MSTTTQAVLCGSCKCAVETVSNPKPHDKVSCPRCGRSDRFDQVMATVREYVLHLTKKAMSEAFAKAARGNRFVKFKAQHVPHRTFRWMTDGKGF